MDLEERDHSQEWNQTQESGKIRHHSRIASKWKSYPGHFFRQILWPSQFPGKTSGFNGKVPLPGMDFGPICEQVNAFEPEAESPNRLTVWLLSGGIGQKRLKAAR
jgi:hypothetical protein